MKATIIFIFLNLSPFVNAQDQCNIRNYKNFINKPGDHKCDLRGADFQGKDLQGKNLQGAKLQGANLFGVDLRGAKLQGAQLQLAILVGADLRDADLTGADLIGVNLGEVDLRGAKLEDTNVNPKQAKYLLKRGLSGFRVIDKQSYEKECVYIIDPTIIKTRGCGGICSGVVKCKGKVDLFASVICAPKADNCPEADICFSKKDKPGNIFFAGTPSEYKKLLRSSSAGSEISGTAQSGGTTGSSGATQ